MDHAGIAQDAEDLARYRAGLQPIVRKEYTVQLTDQKGIFDSAAALLQEIWDKEQQRRDSERF